MFVKIIRGDHSNIYECDRVHVHPRPHAKETKKFTITMEAPGDTITCEISKAVPEALDVYLMNRQGATIDVVFRKLADDDS